MPNSARRLIALAAAVLVYLGVFPSGGGEKPTAPPLQADRPPHSQAAIPDTTPTPAPDAETRISGPSDQVRLPVGFDGIAVEEELAVRSIAPISNKE